MPTSLTQYGGSFECSRWGAEAAENAETTIIAEIAAGQRNAEGRVERRPSASRLFTLSPEPSAEWDREVSQHGDHSDHEGPLRR